MCGAMASMCHLTLKRSRIKLRSFFDENRPRSGKKRTTRTQPGAPPDRTAPPTGAKRTKRRKGAREAGRALLTEVARGAD